MKLQVTLKLVLVGTQCLGCISLHVLHEELEPRLPTMACNSSMVRLALPDCGGHRLIFVRVAGVASSYLMPRMENGDDLQIFGTAYG